MKKCIFCSPFLFSILFFLVCVGFSCCFFNYKLTSSAHEKHKMNCNSKLKSYKMLVSLTCSMPLLFTRHNIACLFKLLLQSKMLEKFLVYCSSWFFFIANSVVEQGAHVVGVVNFIAHRLFIHVFFNWFFKRFL